jgi:hypothetical protein
MPVLPYLPFKPLSLSIVAYMELYIPALPLLRPVCIYIYYLQLPYLQHNPILLLYLLV